MEKESLIKKEVQHLLLKSKNTWNNLALASRILIQSWDHSVFPTLESLDYYIEIFKSMKSTQVVYDRTAKNAVRPNPNGSAISTEGSAEPFGRTSAVFGKILGQMFGPKWPKYLLTKVNLYYILY